jgi:hypothetical protein
VLSCSALMADAEGRRRLASKVLEFARGLGAGEPAPR